MSEMDVRNTGMTEVTPDEAKGAVKRRRPWWRRAVKWLAVAVGLVVALFVAVCSLVVWVLTPARLTPMVERYASEFMNADVGVERVELTFWRTFPRLTVEVDGLAVVSRAFGSLPDSVRVSLPADGDSLLQLRSFSGGLNVAALCVGEVELYDVAFNGLRVNLVQANDSVANYMVFPDAGEESDTVSSPLFLPEIVINRFSLADAGPLRFRSLPDSLDVALTLREVSLAGDEAPRYVLGVDGDMRHEMLHDYNLDGLTFGAQGVISWDSAKPFALALEDFRIDVDRYSVTMAMAADFSGDGVVERFHAETGHLSVTDILRHVPSEYRRFTELLETDMVVRAEMSLARPWSVVDTVLPAVDGSIEIPQCMMVYQGRRFKSFAAELLAHFDGADMDASVFTIRRLLIDGESIDVDFRGDVTGVMSDPLVRGRFKGSVDMGQLPPKLKELIPADVVGVLDGTADFRLHLSDLTRENFHRLYAKGEVNLRNFDATMEDFGRAYARHAVFEFGSNNSFVNDTQQKVDSLLTLSLKIDTLSALGQGMDLRISGLRAGAGSANRRSSGDTTEINPFGMKLVINRLSFESPEDTMRVRLRDASVGGSLRRYKGEAKLPQLNLQLGVGMLYCGQALNKVALRKADIALDMHMRQRRQPTGVRAPRRRSQADSVAGREARQESLDMRLDSAERRFLRRWNFSGHVTAKSGRLVTPYFPLRNRLTNIDLKFNQDSVQLHDLGYKAGQSDFLVNGTVSNLRRALTSHRDNTIGLELTLKSDTINVNEIVRALFAGGSVAQNADSTMVWNDDDTDDSQLAQMADTASTGPLLVPHNIDARFRMRARHVLYSDLELNSFKGDLLVYDGAINLRNLSASTDIGSLRVDGLYSAPDTTDMQFGMGMKVSNFRLDRLTSLVPAIDSLLPAMKSFAGTVNADLAVTTDISPQMEIEIPSLRAALKIEGDSLVLLDADTFKAMSKWLLFRDKKRNMIDHMAVEVAVENSTIELYPFMFDIDRYRLGVMGSNDLAMNMNYHVSVLKSPVPFKFGINIKGTPEKMKIRLGGAKFKENMIGERQAIADNTRVNIVDQMENVFRRGISKARMGRLNFSPADGGANEEARRLLDEFDKEEAMTYEDSLRFIRQGLIENPDTLRFPLHDGVAADSAAPPSGKRKNGAS